jgi:hypothetical protein
MANQSVESVFPCIGVRDRHHVQFVVRVASYSRNEFGLQQLFDSAIVQFPWYGWYLHVRFGSAPADDTTCKLPNT